jgi:hypothetical protein
VRPQTQGRALLFVRVVPGEPRERLSGALYGFEIPSAELRERFLQPFDAGEAIEWAGRRVSADGGRTIRVLEVQASAAGGLRPLWERGGRGPDLAWSQLEQRGRDATEELMSALRAGGTERVEARSRIATDEGPASASERGDVHPSVALAGKNKTASNGPLWARIGNISKKGWGILTVVLLLLGGLASYRTAFDRFPWESAAGAPLFTGSVVQGTCRGAEAIQGGEALLRLTDFLDRHEGEVVELDARFDLDIGGSGSSRSALVSERPPQWFVFDGGALPEIPPAADLPDPAHCTHFEFRVSPGSRDDYLFGYERGFWRLKGYFAVTNLGHQMTVRGVYRLKPVPVALAPNSSNG